ncbi:MAG: HAD family phosphatase [Clostridia bacterium]|nr:HAD family phosphatase [Clostridia bacterium]
MKYKFIASDFDDTFISTTGKVGERTIKAVHDFQSLGGIFMLCSGRMFQSVRREAQEIGFHGDVVCYNGAMVGNIDTGEIKYHNTMSVEVALDILLNLEKENTLIHLYIDDEVYVKEKNEYSDLYKKSCKIEYNVVGYDLSKFLLEKNRPVTKVLAFDTPDRINEMSEKYSAISRVEKKYTVSPSAAYLLDFVNYGASKGEGVKAMCEKLNVSIAETVCFGDSPNDISMLKVAGLGVAVKNARDSVKEAADYVTDSCDDDGVGRAIEKIIKGEL